MIWIQLPLTGLGIETQLTIPGFEDATKTERSELQHTKTIAASGETLAETPPDFPKETPGSIRIVTTTQ